MENLILILVLICVIGSAAFYIYRAKKNGEVCIGCPHAKQCSKRSCYSGNENFNEEK